MNTVGLLGRYFIARFSNDSKSKITIWTVLFLFLLLLSVGGVFWFLASQDISRTGVILIAWTGALAIGAVNGYAYLANFRLVDLPNTPKTLNLWLQIVNSLRIAVAFGMLVLVPFYVGILGWGDYIFVLKLVALSLLTILGLCSFGSFLFLLIRRLLSNALLRSLVVIGLAVMLYRFSNLFQDLATRFDSVLFISNFQATGYLGLTFLGLIGFSLAGLEYLFDSQNIKKRELPNYWNFHFGRRLVPIALSSGAAIFIWQLLQLIRSATWQRKVIFYWTILALVMILARLFTLDDLNQGRIIIFATSLAALLSAMVVSYPSGQYFLNLRSELRRFPITEATLYLSIFWSGLMVNLICAAFFVNFSFIFGNIADSPNYLNILIITLCCHILFFNLPVMIKLRPQSGYYLWFFLCLLPLVFIPVLFFGQAPGMLVAAVLGLWLIANWLFSRWQVGKILVHG